MLFPQANPFLTRIVHISQDDKAKRGTQKPREKEGVEDEEDDSETLDIKEFAALMSVFSIRATREQKLRYAKRSPKPPVKSSI